MSSPPSSSFICLKKTDFFKIQHVELPTTKRVLVTACQYYDIFADFYGKKDLSVIHWCYSYYLACKMYASLHAAVTIAEYAMVFLLKMERDDKMVKEWVDGMIQVEKQFIPLLVENVRKYGRSNIWELVNYTSRQKLWPWIYWVVSFTPCHHAETVLDLATVLFIRFESCKKYAMFSKSQVMASTVEFSERFKTFWINWNQLEIVTNNCLNLKVEDEILLEKMLDKTSLLELKTYLLKKKDPGVSSLNFFDTLFGMVGFCAKLLFLS